MKSELFKVFSRQGSKDKLEFLANSVGFDVESYRKCYGYKVVYCSGVQFAFTDDKAIATITVQYEPAW